MKLSRPMKEHLKQLTEDFIGASEMSPTHPTYSALERRKLAEWRSNPKRPWRGEWKITEAGRAALAQLT